MTATTGFEILPAIDLRGGRVVRLQQGDFARETRSRRDPSAVAQRFADAGRRLAPCRRPRRRARRSAGPCGAVIRAIVEAVGTESRVEVAGGLRTRQSSPPRSRPERRGSSSARRRSRTIGSPPGSSPHTARTGSSSRIDVRRRSRRSVTDGRPERRGVDPADAIGRLADVGITTFEVTAIERDGLLIGPDLALYERMVAIGRGSIIASAGISTLDRSSRGPRDRLHGRDRRQSAVRGPIGPRPCHRNGPGPGTARCHRTWRRRLTRAIAELAADRRTHRAVTKDPLAAASVT